MIKPKCSKCKKAIQGFVHERYKKNVIAKQVLWCGRCWIEKGSPKHEKVNYK